MLATIYPSKGGTVTFINQAYGKKVFSGGMIIFVAYEGIELTANVSSDIENPKKNILE